MINDQRLREAAQTLGPLAYSPHRGELTEQSRQLLQDIEGRIASGQGSSPAPASAD